MKLYTTSWCVKCRAIKNKLPSDIEIVDISDWSDKQIQALGLKSVPSLEDDNGNIHSIESVKDVSKYVQGV